LKNTTSGKEID